MSLNKVQSSLYNETVAGAPLSVSVPPLPSDQVPERLSGRLNYNSTIVDWAYRFDRVLEGTPFRFTIVNTQQSNNVDLILELTTKVTEIANDVLTTNNIDLQAIEDARVAALEMDEEELINEATEDN